MCRRRISRSSSPYHKSTCSQRLQQSWDSLKASKDPNLQDGSKHDQFKRPGNFDSYSPFATCSKDPPPIFKLPVELLQDIVDLLPVESKGCLAFTCKAFRYVIGTGPWRQLSAGFNGRSIRTIEEIADRTSFLLLMSFEPRWFFCHSCIMLHPTSTPTTQLRTKLGEKGCLLYDYDGIIDYFPNCQNISYVILKDHVCQELTQRLRIGGQLDQIEVSSFTASYTTKSNSLFSLLRCDLNYSAKWIRGNLILKVERRFHMKYSMRLSSTDILDFPIWLCPHLTTSTDTEYRRFWTANFPRYNGALLTHVITSLLPLSIMAKVMRRNKKLDELRSTEQEQVKMKDTDQHLWWCRSCPTKFTACLDGNELKITSWQNFGHAIYCGDDGNFKYLARSPTTRSSYAPSRTFVDFFCGDEKEPEKVVEEQPSIVMKSFA